MRQFLFLFFASSLLLSSERSEAQQVIDRSRVKQNREAIFNSPELRYLKNLRGSSRSPNSPFGGGNGNEAGGQIGDGGNGQGQGNNGGQGNNQNAPRNFRRNDPRNNANGGRDAVRPRNDGRNFDPGGRSLFSGGSFGAGAGGFFQFLGYLAIAAMIIAIIVLIVKTFQDREQTLESEFAAGEGMELGEIEPEKPPGLTPSEEFVQRARDLARRGQFREAVALLVLGAMSEVERRGLIRYRRGLTQRDYFRALRSNREIAANYRQMVRIYEPLGFGRRTATVQHFQEALHQFEAGFRERQTISEN